MLQIPHWEKLQLDLLLGVNKSIPPSKIVFDVDYFLYNGFMPQILCISTEKPFDYET